MAYSSAGHLRRHARLRAAKVAEPTSNDVQFVGAVTAPWTGPPDAPAWAYCAGIAGLILLWRRRDSITPRALAGRMAVLLLYLTSILFAPDISYLQRRTNGLACSSPSH